MDAAIGVGDITLSQILAPDVVARFQLKTWPGKWGCIEWTGSLNRGYGVFTLYADRRTLVAHRIAWMIHHRRPVPRLLVVDHLCCNTRCINHDHLEAVTREENTYRRDHPPAGWIQVPNKAKYGIRRKRTRTPDELEQRRLARRAAKVLPPPMVVETRRAFWALWHERDQQTQLSKERSRKFYSREDAETFISLLAVS